ncbi:MAG: hypothetical protein H7Z12_09130 [Rhodospirillaceae bacterium]|nr:hypothetical protein [Rhodospirillales bacterium]
MSEKRPRSGLLSRLTAPIARAARRVVRRGGENADDEVKRLMEMALSETDRARAQLPPAQLTDDAFQMTTKQMLTEDDGAFQVKLHVISLVEFREAVGDKWSRLADKVMMIAEGVINLHMGPGNMFGRQGTDFFVLLFRTVDNDEARRRALIIAQELGTRLVGDQFIGEEIPLALAAEVPLEDGLNEDGSINLDAVHKAVGEIRSMIAGQAKADAPAPRAWMNSAAAAKDDSAPRRHLLPSAPPPRPKADKRPPIALAPERAPKPPAKDPKWKPLDAVQKVPVKDPTWVILDSGATNTLPAELHIEEPGPEPLPADARLKLLWRPTWVAAGEAIGAYKARVQRVDTEGAVALEGYKAYARDDEPGTHTLDRFCIANAIRDFRTSESAGNGSTVIIPVHWTTLTAENRMEFLAPFADLTKQSRGARIIIELFGVPTDVKPMILGTVIQNAKGLCRDVALRTRLSSPRAAMAADCGAAMIGLDMSELALTERTDDDTLLDALKGFLATAGKARLGGYLWSVRRRKVLVGAVQSGFAMVNGSALMKDIPKPAKVLPAPKARFTSG